MWESKEIIRDVESLPVDERLKLIDSLLQSLNPPDPAIDRQWIAEANRRLDQVRSGKGRDKGSGLYSGNLGSREARPSRFGKIRNA